jgi:AcrR family transcriptional regulator
VARIVEAAMDLIDRRGPDGFSVRALAGELGVFPSAVYWHVRDRRTLLALVGARWIGSALPSPEGKHWAQWLRELGHGYRAAALAHPNVARAIAGELVNDPSTFGLPEAILTQLAASGLPDDELVHAYNCMVGAVVGFVDLELARDPVRTPQERDEVRAAVTSVDAQQYPVLAEHIDTFADQAFSLRWTAGVERPLDGSFTYLVELIATGLERRAAPG